MNRTEQPPDQANCRTRPLVWVKKIVLYKCIEPVEEIRQIFLSTGLNIIQGESNESEDAFQSGHGIGKTTVCRLIRYCLGEKTYGQKHVTEEVKHCFPNAYVGAVIELAGADWVVLRPLGIRNKEFAQEGGTLDGLPQAEGTKRYEEFIERLSALVFADVPIAESLTSGQSLQWPHVLAMCSRDQESRYDRFWNWRHTRSESGTPVFRKPKVDAGLCVRAILGLLDPEEPKLRKKVEHLEAALERAQNEIKKKRDEPNFHMTRLRTSLANDFGVQDAADETLDEQSLIGLPASIKTRLESLRQELAEIEEQLSPLDRQINLAAASLLEPTELADQQQTASEVTGEGNDTLLADIKRLRTVRQMIRDAESALCRYGEVLIGECSYVQTRAAQINGEFRERQRTTLPTVTEREQTAARLAEQAKRQRSIIQQIQQRLDDLNRQKNDLFERRRNIADQLRRIPSVLAELQDWNEIVDGRKPNTEIQRLQQIAKNTAEEIEATKRDLAQMIAAQVELAKQFGNRFDAVVRQTLADGVRGVVDIEEEGINFRIMRGESLSGEAYETLAILLADMALLFESNAAHSHHPGILVHDSPREADLNLRIYQRLLDVADQQMRGLEQSGEMPFQYIVTTTTLPSKTLQKKSVTKVKLSGGAGSLFGRQLEAAKTASTQPTLFDTTENE
jgi:hypothetical protein